jgi:hypothetical protein
MRCLLVGLGVGALLLSPTAWAQTTGTSNSDTTDQNTTSGLADRQPAENVRGGAVQERAPARIIDAARARHRGLSELRISAQRSGDTSILAPEETIFTSSGNGGLANLLGGSLSSLLNTFLGSGLTGTSSGGSSSGVDVSSLPDEVIAMLEGAGIDLKDLEQLKENQDADAAAEAKTLSRSQTTTTTTQQEERKFIVRWADAMLSTFFAALTVGFQTSDFIDLLADALRPIFNPASADNSGTTDGSDGAATDGGTSGDSSADGAGGNSQI